MRAIDELPWDSGWAVGSKTASLLVELLDETKPRLILDIGSGLTTVLFGEWAKHNGARVVSLEHSRFYYNKTKALIDTYDVDVDLRLCKLAPTDRGMFYATDLPDNIDFVMIDGPPGSIGRRATLYSVYPHLAEGFTAWLDDAARPDEKAMLQDWQNDLSVQVSHREGFTRGAIICAA